jgi:site-specific DNA-methyltransferase (adenine-specific)
MGNSPKRRLAKLYRYRRAGITGRIVQGDALTFLRSLPGNTADIVFLDPPFNLGKRYSNRSRKLDSVPEADYKSWLTKILWESGRVLKNGGALYLYHLPVWAMRLGSVVEQDSDLRFQHWIAISMKNGFVRGDHLYPAHYALLMFSKGTPLHFKRPKLEPQKCRHCGELIKDYGGYLPIIEAKGINLSDFWEDLSPVRHRTKKHRPANELPPKFFERVLSISGKRGGVFVDPFAGGGSGIVAAVGAGMRFEACDAAAENCLIVRRRLLGAD